MTRARPWRCRAGWHGSNRGSGTATPARRWPAPTSWPPISPPWTAPIRACPGSPPQRPDWPPTSRNNIAALPDYGKRYRTGEAISTAFVESTVNLVVGKRFAKKQQMQWSKQGAHRLLQTRTRTLNGTLRDLFARWYPALAVNDNELPIPAAA